MLEGYKVSNMRKPNIVMMVADNTGYGDLGCYGGGELRGAPTPNLDRMAREGLRMTSFYTETQCTPTRAALMTGRLPVRDGMTVALIPGAGGGMSENEVTLAEILSDAGYETALFGKWHLGDSDENLPQMKGFDEFWGFLYHVDAYLYKERIGFDEKAATALPGLVQARRGQPLEVVKELTSETLPYIDEEAADKTVRYIKERSNSERPFFLYVPFCRPHYPNVPHPDWQGKSRIGDYGDAQMELDHHSGMVLDAVRDAGIAENTLVIWFSDNGPTNYSWPDSGFTPFRGEVGTGLEGGIRCPAIFWWPGAIEPSRVSNEIMASLDFYNTLAALGGATVPSDRPIDGVDQSAFLRGEQSQSNREHVMTFVGRDLVTMRWRQFKVHFKVKENMMGSVLNNQFPYMYNIEMDPREEHDIAGQNLWLLEVSGRYVKELEKSFAEFPNREPQS